MHPSAQQDALTAARHRAFIAPRLLGSIIALAAFPAYLIARGAPSLGTRKTISRLYASLRGETRIPGNGPFTMIGESPNPTWHERPAPGLGWAASARP